MPITRYIGRDPIFKGKSLYEIARQLRDLGVGRIVYRQSQSTRWPGQKTYFRLTKVVPDATCTEFKTGSAWGEEVFRGKKRGITEITTGHKYDWVLVPKDEEDAFCNETEVFDIDPQSIPKTMACPPLLEMVIQKDLKASGQPVPEKVQLPFFSEGYIKDLEWKWKS
ncbi:28S ribosomal protein s34, mitochondrial [Plakobranchus ocellatus]|uniref:28S ribosomal protein s34, mitochondrial n=1 Tax=Plakobranchus ocellatus TaxID=259542 RepID=A0AAV3XVD5_9GAST|nr:28S ribosomal protein s34, mitochondrial [Plakobranchus ocellatus]